MSSDRSSAILTAADLEVRYNEQIVLNRASLAIGERVAALVEDVLRQ